LVEHLAEPAVVDSAGNLAKYLAVCVPAFAPETVHRDD
jgi:hypothetical protein